MPRMRRVAAVVFLAAAMLGVAPAPGSAGVADLPEARYDDPTNTFHVTDSCGDRDTSLLRYKKGTEWGIRLVDECGEYRERIFAVEDSPLVWQVCIGNGRVCSDLVSEDV